MKQQKFSVTFNRDSSSYWEKTRVYNIHFLKSRECYANEKLRVSRWLLLNDIYDILGLPRTVEGCTTGWIYDESGFIDFNINPKGTNPNVKLEFNTDGYIIDKLREKGLA